MPVKPVLSVADTQGRRTAAALRELADRADRGEVIGVAIAAWTERREPLLAVAGAFETAPHAAHYVVCQLQDALLYPSSD